VAQQRVPILPDDTAREVFDKVTVAAEICLDDVLTALLGGHEKRPAKHIARGSYFGGRKPGDGRIDWTRTAPAIHDLVRAVAPPYPGARPCVAGAPARILRSRWRNAHAPARRATLVTDGAALVAHCGG